MDLNGKEKKTRSPRKWGAWGITGKCRKVEEKMRGKKSKMYSAIKTVKEKNNNKKYSNTLC